MRRGSEAVRDGATWKVERALVLQVLSEDHAERWSRVELARAISDCDPSVLDRALARLHSEGVLHQDGSEVWASRAVRVMDQLELIGI
jgi:DNA-binding HxlR family transcriptional regulator